MKDTQDTNHSDKVEQLHDQAISRRSILKTVSGAAGATAVTGLAAAHPSDETVEVNVGYASQTGLHAAEQAAQQVVRRFAFDALTIEIDENAISGLEDRSDIRYVEQNGLMHALHHKPGHDGGPGGGDGSTSETLPWGIDRVDADVAHANGETGGDDTDGEGGADIAIIDTGIDDDHPDLQDNLAKPLDDTKNHKAWVECKGSNCNYPWSDDNDHGTHCAGIAGALDNSEGVIGISPTVTLHALKVLDKSGSGTFSNVAAAIEHTADQGWDVASMSLGASSGSSVVKDACKYAYNNDVLLVAAAGNDGPCTDCVSYPAKYKQVIAVSATSCDDTLASFSSTGCEVEIAAPGDDVYSSIIGGYDTFDGTSMATPHVSGAGAQLMDNGYTNATQSSSDAESATCYPDNPGGARGQLQDSAEDIGLASNEQGMGLLDVAKALGLSSTDDGTGNGPNC